jgi:hypothetical protein
MEVNYEFPRREFSETQASEMRFLRHAKGCRKIDRLTNEYIRNKPENFPINRHTEENRSNWGAHLDRMSEGRIPNQILTNSLKGKRDVGHPRKRWRERDEVERSRRPKP